MAAVIGQYYRREVNIQNKGGIQEHYSAENLTISTF